MDAIVAALGLRPGRRVLELGAGTGKLTRLLTPSGAQVLALEPVAEMRSELAARVPEAAPLDGTAEAVPLPEGGADAAVAAQAWHWFDAAAALRELERVLVPRAPLALVWNEYDPDVAWSAELGAYRHRRQALGEIPTHRDRAWREPLDASGGWAPLEHRRFHHVQPTTPDGVVERMLSTSVIAAGGEEEQAAAVAAVRGILERHGLAAAERVDLPHVTELYLTHRLA